MFAGIGVLAGVGAFLAFLRSQPDADLAAAPPTKIIDHTSGLEVSTSSSVLSNKEATLRLAEMIQVALIRKPVPSPSGTVDADGAPNVEGQAEMAKQIAAINARTAELEKVIASTVSPANHLLGISTASLTGHGAELGEIAPPSSL